MIVRLTVGETLDREKAFALHHACFGDGEAWFTAFLKAAKGQQYIACILEEEYTGGMFLLDVTYGAYRGKYVYALGVHPDCRGKGIAKKLIEEAKALSHDFCLICAADGELAKTYARNGFDTFVGGTVPLGATKGAEADVAAYTAEGNYKDVHGLKLCESLFTFALSECGATLRIDGKKTLAVAKDGVYATFDTPLVQNKAQLYLKTDMDVSHLTADLILEV